jgi:hypothetical protein
VVAKVVNFWKKEHVFERDTIWLIKEYTQLEKVIYDISIFINAQRQ